MPGIGATIRPRIAVAVVCAALLGALPLPSSSWALSNFAYVANESGATVSQFTIGAGEALSPNSPATVAAGSSSLPFSLAATPDGKSVYLTGRGGVIDQYDVAADGTLSAKSPASIADANLPLGIAVSPDGKSAYVTNNGNGTVSQFSIAADGSLSAKSPATVAAGNAPWGVIVSPDGKSVYVANDGGGTVSQYDVAADGTLSAKSPATVSVGSGSGSGPNELAISPDGTSVYVAAIQDNAVAQFDVGAGGVLAAKSPAEVTTGALTRPEGIVVSPDGTSVYTGDAFTGTISQFSVGAGGSLSAKSPATVSSGTQTRTLWMTPDGKSLYADNYNMGTGTTASQYDVAADGTLSAKSPATVTTGSGPNGVLVLPDQGPVASFTASAAVAGSPSTFDGSGSSDPDGTVARYDWSFGDGTSAPNAGPTPTHTYASRGSYTVTLTVTDDAGCSTTQVFTGRTVYCNGSALASATRTVTLPAPPAAQIIAASAAVPKVSKLKLQPDDFLAATNGPAIITALDTGTIISYLDTLASHTKFRVLRCAGGHGSCKKLVAVGSFTHQDHAGKNRLHFTGRLHGHALAAGRYLLRVTATLNGQHSRRAMITFTILPPPPT